jgi:hypothetical protein
LFILFIGTLLPHIGRRLLLARRESPFGPSTWVAVGFALWFGLVVAWMTHVAPDWMLMYTIPAEELPLPFVHGVFVLLLLVMALAGHTLNAVLIQRSQRALAVVVTVSALVIWLSSHVLTAKRYMAVGTFADFYAGRTVPLPESAIATDANVVFLLFLPWIVPAVFVYRNGQRLRPT